MTTDHHVSVDIAVIVVNYNTGAMALDAVESVLSRRHSKRKIHIFVVDNASPNGDSHLLRNGIVERGWTKFVTLYESPRNVGFGAGNNLVLSQLGHAYPMPKYAFLLNPDATLANDAVGILADFLDAHPSAAAAGAAILSPGGKPATAAFRFPGIVSTFSSALAWGPVSRALRAWEVSFPPSIATRPVDWVAGAAVMMRMSAVHRAGYFDPYYFLYFEEVDLMYQIKRQGADVWHVSEARVTHVEGASTGVNSGSAKFRRLPAYWYESWRHYFLKNHGRVKALLVALSWYAGAVVNKLLRIFPGRRSHAPDGFFRDFWRVSVRPLLGLRQLPYD